MLRPPSPYPAYVLYGWPLSTYESNKASFCYETIILLQATIGMQDLNYWGDGFSQMKLIIYKNKLIIQKTGALFPPVILMISWSSSAHPEQIIKFEIINGWFLKTYILLYPLFIWNKIFSVQYFFLHVFHWHMRFHYMISAAAASVSIYGSSPWQMQMQPFTDVLQAWRPTTLLKRDSNTGAFLWILQNS